MIGSYQNSAPGQLHDNGVESGAATENQTFHAATSRQRFFRSVVLVATVFLLAMAFMGSPINESGAIRGSSQQVSLLQSAEASAHPPKTKDMPKPDYDGEGRYDWQKCKASNDPDCWKNEGDRVGSYWSNFRLRMKTFWMNFRGSMHNFFAGESEEAPGVAADDGSTKTKEAVSNVTVTP